MAIKFIPPPTPNTEPTASNTPPADGVRVLTQEEIQTVAHIFTQAGASLPDPAMSVFIGSVVGGEVVAFLVLQVRLHAEPMWIKDGHSTVFSSLVTAAERHILKTTGPQWVYLFAPAGRVQQLAHVAGMQMEPWVVMSKLVVPPPVSATPLVDLMPTVEEGEQIQ